MEKKQYICPKCGCQQYESDQFQATGGNFAKIFDVQNKKFITISCRQCGYTELIKARFPTDGIFWISLSVTESKYPINKEAVSMKRDRRCMRFGSC